MAAVEVTISGLLYDKLNRTTQNVVLIGEATLTGIGVGGGPIYPPPGKPPGGGGDPPGIWGGPIDPYPDHGLPQPPGTWPPQRPPHPAHPIIIPPPGGGTPPELPPGTELPPTPEPGDPTQALPGNWPVQPITPPPYIIVQYPGIGPVVVAPPETAAQSPSR